MGANTAIEWCDHTFNPWVGCTKIAPPCDFCYAEVWAKRTGHPELWKGERRRTTAANWREPLKWNRQAIAEGVRRRVFCASLADIWDNQVDPAWRRDLFDLIWQTRDGLDWLLLTKRPMNIEEMLPGAIGEIELWPWPNVWFGTTCGDREEYKRNWAYLRLIPAAVHFISYEPALGPLSCFPFPHRLVGNEVGELLPDWIICGGESGPHARSMHPDWARAIRDECERYGIAFMFKQWGEWAPSTPEHARGNPRAGWQSIKAHPTVAKFADLLPENGAAFVERVGKKAAGRLLDGRTHDGFPQVRA